MEDNDIIFLVRQKCLMEEEAEVSQTKKSFGLSDLRMDSPSPPPLPLSGPPLDAAQTQTPPPDQGHCNGGAILQTESETRIKKQELVITETDI